MTVKWQDYIEERRDVMLGKPVFKGTRLTVEQVLRELGAGISHEELLRNYSRLKAEHLQAAMQYAAATTATGYLPGRPQNRPATDSSKTFCPRLLIRPIPE